MPCRFFILAIPFTFVCAVTTVHADVFDSKAFDLVLTEFDLKAQKTPLEQDVACTLKMIEAGVDNLVSFGPRDNSHRHLVPSDNPLANEAAWLLKDGGCPSLAPYLNGLGFGAFDATTGFAEIYFAEFVRLPNPAWDENTITNMRNIFRPGYRIRNRLVFDAKCTAEGGGVISQVMGREYRLVCEIAGGAGQIAFRLVPRT